MKQQVARIDEQGMYVEPIIIKQGEILTEEITVIDEETQEETTQVIPRADIVYDPVPQGFYHPRWDGEKWVEGKTQEEIDKIRNQPIPPTETQLLGQQMVDLELRNLMLEMDNDILGEQLINQELKSLELENENKMLGQQIVNLELMILGGNA